MNKIILSGVVIVISAASLYFLMPPKSDEKTSEADVNVREEIEPSKAVLTIVMKNLKYSGTEMTIKQGEVIEFRNEGGEEYWPASNIHPSHGIYPEFDPQRPIKLGESWFFKFDRIGSWRFHDHLYPKEIKGVITVNRNL